MGRDISNVNLLLGKERITGGPFLHYEFSDSDASLGGDVPRRAVAGAKPAERRASAGGARGRGLSGRPAPAPRDTI